MRRIAAFVVLVLSRSRLALAENPPMPEAIFTETVTDIDGHAPGEFEIEMSGSEWRALRGGSRELEWTLEGEAIILPRIGIRAEMFSLLSSAVASQIYGFNAAASVKLIQDFRHDFHLQAEIGGRYPADASLFGEPGESALPATLDLRAGYRHGYWTLRTGIGLEAGGTAAYAPIRANVALLRPFGPTRCGFFGIELDADFGRRAPLIMAFDFVPNLTVLRLPFKIGLALPWAVGVRANEPALGLFVRIFVESEREIEYGARGR